MQTQVNRRPAGRTKERGGGRTESPRVDLVPLSRRQLSPRTLLGAQRVPLPVPEGAKKTSPLHDPSFQVGRIKSTGTGSLSHVSLPAIWGLESSEPPKASASSSDKHDDKSPFLLRSVCRLNNPIYFRGPCSRISHPHLLGVDISSVFTLENTALTTEICTFLSWLSVGISNEILRTSRAKTKIRPSSVLVVQQLSVFE